MSVVELRDYQKDLLMRVEQALEVDAQARVIMQLPTGGGKTVIAGDLLKRRLSGGRKAVWLTHRTELADQTRRMLTDRLVPAMAPARDWHPGISAPSMSHGVVILMAQTVGRRSAETEVWREYCAADLMVVDEAHHATAKGWERAMDQWPGQVLGLTATPWRLSEKEGLNHLFHDLILGPQIAELQSMNWLCGVRVILPLEEQTILGGVVPSRGDYTEGGIEEANAGRDVMTVGTLRFWQEVARDRQTIIYAVSVAHAHNLVAVFKDANISATALLGDTSRENRNKAISAFRDGTLSVLVNVAVATEGFDLPDASCVVIARPTLSLALYMQMVGRGLRPKCGGGDCLILDLAANSMTHGMPEENREWSLDPRGKQLSDGNPVVVRCSECGAASPAASHNCRECGKAFGEKCDRCGKWRAWQRWKFKDHCGGSHQVVCDNCHNDAHEGTHIPQLGELAGLVDDEESMEIDDEVADKLAPILKELLKREHEIVTAADRIRQDQLRQYVIARENLLNDDGNMEAEFIKYVDQLAEEQRPRSGPQRHRRFVDWEDGLRKELNGWRDEMRQLEGHPINKRLIFGNTRDKVVALLSGEAKSMGVMPSEGTKTSPVAQSDEGWISISSPTQSVRGRKPIALRTPSGEISITSWNALLVRVAEWLIQQDLLPKKSIRTKAKGSYVIDVHPDKFRYHQKLSNGLYIEINVASDRLLGHAAWLIECSSVHTEFFVKLA